MPCDLMPISLHVHRQHDEDEEEGVYVSFGNDVQVTYVKR